MTFSVNMQFRLTNSQWYLVNAKPGTNHSTNPTNPNGNSKLTVTIRVSRVSVMVGVRVSVK